MMKKLSYLVFSILVMSCGLSEDTHSYDKEKVAKETRAMLIEYHVAMNKDGLEAEFKYLDSSEDFFWVPPGYQSALTFDSVKTILLKNGKALESVHFEWRELNVYPHASNLASYTGIVKGNTIDTLNMESEMLLIESGTLIKRENSWKLLNGQTAILNNE